MTTITTGKLREIAHYMNTTVHDIRALAVSRGVTIDDTPADTEEPTMGKMTITQEQFEAAEKAWRYSQSPNGLTEAFAAAGITITPAEPPAEMVKLSREIAAKLTKAERAGLIMASHGAHGLTGISIAARTTLGIDGLIERARELEGEDDPLLFRITPLGLAVRAILQAKEPTDER